MNTATHPNRSVFADRSAAERALAMALPMIEPLMRDKSVVGSGFAVWLDGIVVGVSGAHAYYDEAFATCIAACLRAVAKQRWTEAVAGRKLFA